MTTNSKRADKNTRPPLPCNCGCGQTATDGQGRNRGPENQIKHGHAYRMGTGVGGMEADLMEPLLDAPSKDLLCLDET